jgi:hypothetical protein
MDPFSSPMGHYPVVGCHLLRILLLVFFEILHCGLSLLGASYYCLPVVMEA